VGCDASGGRVVVHLAPNTPLDGIPLAQFVARTRGYQLTPEGKLICRFEPESGVDAIDRVRSVLSELFPMRKTH
jgi:hypothetical protein